MHKKLNQSGFSLIELSIALIIVSLSVVTAIKIAQITFYEETENKLIQSLTQKNDLLLTHYVGVDASGNNIRRLPCPALQNLAIDHPDFGKENCASATIVNTDIPDPDNPSDTLKILIGAMPIQSLSTPVSEAFDVYDSQYIYAVSQGLIQRENFLRSSLSAISVERQAANGSATNIILPFIVASTGETRRGGYDKSGTLIEACPTSSDQNENCDGDFRFKDAYFDPPGPNNEPETAFFDGRIATDETFFARATNAVFLSTNCPSGEILSGFVDGEAQCAPVIESAAPPSGTGTGNPVDTNACGPDAVSILGICVSSAYSNSK